MTDTPKGIPYMTRRKKHIIPRETFLLIGILAAIFIAVFVGFYFLWTYFKIGFLWMISFIAFVYTRKTDAWKIGVETMYFLAFVATYTLGYGFAVPLIYISLAVVFKLRPDEVPAVITHYLVLTGVMITANYASGRIGPGITESQLLFWGLGSMIFWDNVRNLIALKTVPVHWTKLVTSTSMSTIINYLYYTFAGMAVLHFFYGVA